MKYYATLEQRQVDYQVGSVPVVCVAFPKGNFIITKDNIDESIKGMKGLGFDPKHDEISLELPDYDYKDKRTRPNWLIYQELNHKLYNNYN